MSWVEGKRSDLPGVYLFDVEGGCRIDFMVEANDGGGFALQFENDAFLSLFGEDFFHEG